MVASTVSINETVISPASVESVLSASVESVLSPVSISETVLFSKYDQPGGELPACEVVASTVSFETIFIPSLSW